MGKTKTKAPAKGKRAAADANQWWTQAEEAPRAGLPDATRLNKKARRLRWFVWATLVLLPLSLFLNIAAITNSDAGTKTVTSLDQYGATKADALVAVRNWLATKPSPLPGGTVIGWESATSKKSPKDPDAPEDQYRVEVHRVALATPSGALFDSVVSLGVSDAIGTVVIGEPSLIPRAVSDDTWTDTTWPGMESVMASEDVEFAVAAWADAYDSGDPAMLRLAVGDTDAGHSYMPLVGATLLEPAIEDAVGIWSDSVPEIDRDEVEPSTIVVRATFGIRWQGEPVPISEEYPLVTYDLLVRKADTAAPVVVAWGGAGTGPSLKAYANAVSGRVIEAPTGEEVREANADAPKSLKDQEKKK